MSAPADGQRHGRFVTFRDAEGVRHAVASSAVVAITECDGACFVTMPGGRVIRVEQPLMEVLSWFDVGVRWQ